MVSTFELRPDSLVLFCSLSIWLPFRIPVGSIFLLDQIWLGILSLWHFGILWIKKWNLTQKPCIAFSSFIFIFIMYTNLILLVDEIAFLRENSSCNLYCVLVFQHCARDLDVWAVVCLKLMGLRDHGKRSYLWFVLLFWFLF